MILEYLKEAGLSKNEAKIYKALVEYGPSAIGPVSIRTKIHRRNVYDSMQSLNEKGFVSWIIKNNRKQFEAVSPKRVLDIFEEKKQKFSSLMPLLSRKQRINPPTVKVYTGMEGRKIIFEDKLESKGEQLVLGAHSPQDRITLYLKNYHKRRIAKKIPLKMLFTEKIPKDSKVIRYFADLKYVRVRVLPRKMKSPIAINIYKGKVALFLGSKTESPLTVLIEDKDLCADFSNYFYTLWENAKEV